MLDHTFPVQIGAKRYSKEFQKEQSFAPMWRRVLENAHGHLSATCCCPGRGARKLVIRSRETTFHLARYPLTGSEHVNECRFYAPAPETSGMQGYEKGVIEEGEDGELRVKLSVVPQELPAREETGTFADAATAPVAKPDMSLQGLLHLLWQEARLNIWYPAMAGKRSPFILAGALHSAAERIITNKVAIADTLLLPATKGSKWAEGNPVIATRSLENGAQLLAVSPLARYVAQKHSDSLDRLPLSMPFGMPMLFLQRGQWGRVHQKFRREISAWIRGEHVIVIAQIEMKAGAKRPYGKVIDLALMHVSAQWIPIDSSHQGVIEAKLRDEGRAFEKPMRFEADDAAIFPDFWLLDAGEHFPMEVFGMDTQQNPDRKAAKVRHYNRERGTEGWWSWNAYRDPEGLSIPAFPPSVQR